MRRFSFFTFTIAIVIFCLSALTTSAQTAQLRGHVVLKQADGTTVPTAGAQIDVFRTDLPGDYPTKADKKGQFVYAGLPLVGTYLIAASAPNAAPYVLKDVKVGRDIDYELVLSPGNGHRFTKDEAKAAATGMGSPATSSGGESAADKAKAAEIAAKNKEIEEKNKKIEASNQIVGDSFKAGNVALNLKNYDEAIKQYDIGLAADPEQAALLTNKAAALKARGVDKYNASITNKDTAGADAAKADFKAAAEAANTAAELLKKEPTATDPAEKDRQDKNKYAAFSVRAEAMRLFVTKTDASQADAGIAAYQDYIAVETDPARKARAQYDMAQMLLDAGAADKAIVEFQKIVNEKPDDPDANLGLGLALFSTGDKAKYQDAANYLQHFVDKAPDTHKFKNDAKAVLAELKSTENVTPEKTTPASRRKRP